MSETSEEVMVRQVTVSEYDGKSTVTHERITVKVIWPDKKPATKTGQYAMYGDWIVVREAE